MKKRVLFLITCVLLEGSTLNVYGESFNMQSPGMEIFNVLNEEGLTKQEAEEQLGVSDRSEKMFHAVYDYSLDGVDGELKIRYDDRGEDTDKNANPLGLSEITNAVNEDTETGRILWKAKESYLPENYEYQIKSLGEIDGNSSIGEMLTLFQEVPSELDDVISDSDETMQVQYKNYPMFGENGTLILNFENSEIKKKNSWIFEVPEGKTFSDYSELICTGWLTTMSDMVDWVEAEYDDEPEAEFLIMCVRKVCDYYKKAFQEENKQEMKVFNSALKNLYLMVNGKESKLGSELEEWLSTLEAGGEEISPEKISENFLEIWMNTDQCEDTWEQIVEQDYSEDHFSADGLPVNLGETRYDENLEVRNSKYIEIKFDMEEYFDEE